MSDLTQNSQYQLEIPTLKKDIALLEKVQRRATKISPSIKNLSYEKRLECLKLTTLQTRRLRGDLIQKFKIEKGLDKVEWVSPPPMSAPKSYRRSQCQRELIKNCAQRYNFFNNRIASEWNALPNRMINSETVNQFKACLDKRSFHSGSSTVDLLCVIELPLQFLYYNY